MLCKVILLTIRTINSTIKLIDIAYSFIRCINRHTSFLRKCFITSMNMTFKKLIDQKLMANLVLDKFQSNICKNVV